MKDKEFSEIEKSKILDDLNETRLSEQRRTEIAKNRTYKKKTYKLASKTCYKFMYMEREYYINVEDCKKITRKPQMITLYYKALDELKTKTYLIRTEIFSEKFFISEDPIRVYFKEYALEKEKKTSS